MNNNRRRNFRGRQQKNSFRRRAPLNHSSNGHYTNNTGNKNFTRNGSMSNPSSIEKVIFKYQQLAKDAQSSGDPVLIENYLQHAEHYSRKLAEINLRSQPEAEKNNKIEDTNANNESIIGKKIES